MSHVNFPEDFKELSFEKGKFGLIKTRITSGSHMEKNRTNYSWLVGHGGGWERIGGREERLSLAQPDCFVVLYSKERSYVSDDPGTVKAAKLCQELTCGLFLGLSSWEGGMSGLRGLWSHRVLDGIPVLPLTSGDSGEVMFPL